MLRGLTRLKDSSFALTAGSRPHNASRILLQSLKP